MAELASGREPRYPLPSVQAYLDWKRFKIPPFPGGTRSWPADFLDELRYIHDSLATARATEQPDAGGDVGEDE